MGKAGSRSFLGWLRGYVLDGRRSPRRGARFAARVPAVVNLLEAGAKLGPEASSVLAQQQAAREPFAEVVIAVAGGCLRNLFEQR